MLRKLMVVLLLCFSFTSAQAQTNVEFVDNDFVLITIPRLPVYTQIQNDSTIAAEMLRGMRSRVMDVAEADDGSVWVYLEDFAFGWVPTILRGEPTMTLYSPRAIAQMLESAEEAVQTIPDDAESYVWRATVNMTLNAELYLVEADYTMAIDLDPADPALLEYRARAYFDMNEWGFAVVDLEDAIAQGRQLANTYNRAGIAYQGSGDYERVIEYFELGLEVVPDYGILTGNIGNQYYNMDEYETAIDYYEQALDIDEHLTYLYGSIGNVYKIYSDYDAAVQEYSTGIDVDPYCYDCFRLRGQVYGENLGDLELAIDDIQTAIRIDPYEESAFISLGITYIYMGDIDAALEAYKTAQVLNPNNDFTYFNLGYAFGHQGEYQQSLENYTHAVDLFGFYAHASLVYRAQVYLALEQYDNAISDSDIFIAGLNNNAENMYFIATARIVAAAAYAHMADYARAQQSLELAFDTAGEFVINYEIYGEGYWVTPLRLEEGFDVADQFENDRNDADKALRAANLLLEFGYWEVAQSYYQAYVDLRGDRSSELAEFIDFLEELYD